MIKLIGVFLICATLMMGCGLKENDPATEKERYQKAKETLEVKEKKNPVAFLLVNSRDKRNLIGQMVVKGHVSNIAKVCTYKDIRLQLSFFSKTGTLLLTTNETVYDQVGPGKSVTFKAKEFSPKGTDSVAIKVIGALTN